jgi:hypothetical protein
LTLPVELHMRVGGAVTYRIAPGHKVKFVDMTPDGRKLYFTSAEALSAADTDTSTDLYMWSESGQEAGEPLTLVSLGKGGTGNTDGCNAAWTTKCGILPILLGGTSKLRGGTGGNGVSDRSMATESGDIFFFSPEKLDGGNAGLNGADNLYLYRDGSLTFVGTFSNAPVCASVANEEACSESPIGRMNVSPDGDHAAFVTTTQLTPYNSANHVEMYSYDAESRHIECVSCIPDGRRPQHDVRASQNGLFMADDGRAFFSTDDAVVPQDTNETEDVYEFVEGRPRLISGGTAAANSNKAGAGQGINAATFPGLVGVSADGTDVYFATYDVLVAQDRNGEELKVYDARTGGGFPFVKASPGCAAADECHGPGSSAPSIPTEGSGAYLGSGGNLSSGPRRKKTSHRRNKTHKKGRGKVHRKHHGGGKRG